MLFWILHSFRLTKFIEVTLTFWYCFKIFTTYFPMSYCSETTIHTCGMPFVITVQFLLLGVHRQLKTCFDKYWFLKYSTSGRGPPRRCGWYASLIFQNVKIPIQVNSILYLTYLSVCHRVTITVYEPFTKEIADRNSKSFKDFSQHFSTAMDTLLEDINGNLETSVINVER